MNKEKIVLRVGNKEEFSIKVSTKGGQRQTHAKTKTHTNKYRDKQWEGRRERQKHELKFVGVDDVSQSLCR